MSHRRSAAAALMVSLVLIMLLAAPVSAAQALPVPTEAGALPVGGADGVEYALPPDFDATRDLTIVVTTTADENDGSCGGGAGISLREALTACLTDSTVIYVPNGTYTVSGYITANNHSVVLVGQDRAGVIIQAAATPEAATDGIFAFLPDTTNITVSNLTIRNTAVPALSGGGGIFLFGTASTVLLYNVLMTDNRAGFGGAVYIEGGIGSAPVNIKLQNSTLRNNQATNGDGGALYFYGDTGDESVVMESSVFEGNTAEACAYGGGAVSLHFASYYGNAHIHNSTFTGNSTVCADYSGGAVLLHSQGNYGFYSVTHSTFTGNTASGPFSMGGGLAVDENWYGSLNIDGSTFSGNTAGIGGGLYHGFGQLTTITDATFTGNKGIGNGGAALFVNAGDTNSSIDIRGSTITGNIGGGDQLGSRAVECIEGYAAVFAFYENSAGVFNLHDSLVADNTLDCTGVGVGGGVSVIFDEDYGSATISDSVIARNTITAPNGGGGGVYVHNMNGSLSVLNTVLEANHGGPLGGGLYVQDTTTDIRRSVFLRNSAETVGGIYHVTAGGLTMTDTVVAHNMAVDSIGGLWVSGETNYFKRVAVVGNSVTNPAGNGGGFSSPNNSTWIDSVIEGNTAAVAPNCMVSVLGEMKMLGNVWVGNIDSCDINDMALPDMAANVYGNVVANPGFEIADPGNDKLPADWSASNLTGDKRKCSKLDKPAKTRGWCVFIFKGGVSENASLKQDVDLSAVLAGDVLTLATEATAGSVTTGVVKAKVTYANSDTAKLKVKYQGATTGIELKTDDLTAADTITSANVKLKHKGMGNKWTVDRVYLTVAPGVVRFVEPREADDMLPPPAAPDGFRGGN